MWCINPNRKRRHPLTGDEIAWGEWLSWMAQSIIRRWSFLFMLTLLTVLSWVWGVSNATILLWWNLAASFLALVIESLVGMGMFHQTLRDAMILREVRSLSQRIE